jgi:hypothetical protein
VPHGGGGGGGEGTWGSALFSSSPESLHSIPLNVWTHAWNTKYRVKK